MWIALVPMLAWGSIGLVSGKMGGDAHQQTLGMTFGALIFAIVTTIFSFQHFCNITRLSFGPSESFPDFAGAWGKTTNLRQ